MLTKDEERKGGKGYKAAPAALPYILSRFNREKEEKRPSM